MATTPDAERPTLILDASGTYVDVNQAALDLLGYTAEEVVGHPVEHLAGDVADETRTRFERLVRSGFARGDAQFARADGTTVMVSFDACRMEGEAGPRFVMALRRGEDPPDVFDDLALAAETRLLTVVDTVVDAIITIDDEQRILYFNATAELAFGCAAAEAVGQPLDRFIPERFRSSHRADVTRFAETGVTARTMGHLGTVYGLRADGTEFPLEGSISRVALGGRQILTVIARDVSDRLPADERSRLQADIASLRGRADRFGDLFAALDSLTDAALRHLALDDLLSAMMQRLVSVLRAESASVLLRDREREVLVRRASVGLEQGFEDVVEVPIGMGVAGAVAQTKEPMLVRDTADHDVVNPAIRRYLGSLIAVPLLHEDDVIGVLHVGSSAKDAFSETDMRFVSVVAARLAASIENARLQEALEAAYAAEHRQRLHAEQAVDWTNVLQGVTSALADAGTVGEANDVLLDRSMSAVGAAAGAVLIQEAGELTLEAARGYPEDVLATWPPVPMDSPLPSTETVRTGQTMWLPTKAAVRERFPLSAPPTEPTALEALISLPLVVSDRAIGALVLEFEAARSFEDGEVALLSAIAKQAAQAHERLRLLDLERHAAARARRLIEANVVGVMVGGADGRLVDANDAVLTMLGYSREDLAAGLLNWRDLTPPEYMARSVAAVHEAEERGGAAPYEKEYLHKDGHRVPVLVGLALLETDPFQAIAYVVDLSEREAAERERERLLEQERRARDRAEAANERLAFLSEASRVLASSLDYSATLRSVARAAVPRLADWCAIDLVTEDGAVERLAVEHVDPAKVQFAWEISRLFPVDLHDGSTSGVAHVLRTNTPELVEEIPLEMIEASVQGRPEVVEAILALDLRSAMFVPLSIGSQVLGAITFVMAESGRTYGQVDLSLAEELARRGALAIDNARLYDRERSARQEAELATGRLRLLADLDEALLSAPDLTGAAQALSRFLADRIGDYVLVHLVGRDGQIGHTAGAHREMEPDLALQTILEGEPPDIDDPENVIVASIRGGTTSLIETMTDDDLARLATPAQLAAWNDLGCGSSIVVPIPLRDRILGAISICRSPGSAPLGVEDLGFLRDLAERASQALDNARLYGEHAYVADTLQRSLLPPSLPEIPGISIGVGYRPAGDGTQVGGDFYDVFETVDDEWAVSIGDVCGKGSGAAAIMALSRYTIRTAALHESRPSAILATLNEALLRQTTESRFCTACQVRLRRRDDGARLTISCGGHPLPLILRRDGGVETAGTPGTLLGFFPDPTLTDRAVDLEPGDTLLLYTDGLTDERREDEEFGEERVGALLRSCHGVSADEIVTRLMTAVMDFRDEDPQDDIAILAVQVRVP